MEKLITPNQSSSRLEPTFFNEIEKHYVKGCAAYYDEFTPNFWQHSHGKLNEALQSNDLPWIQNTKVTFIAQLLYLIEAYKNSLDNRGEVILMREHATNKQNTRFSADPLHKNTLF